MVDSSKPTRTEEEREAMRRAVEARAAAERPALPVEPPAQLTESLVIRCERENYLGDAKIYAHLHRDQVLYVLTTEKWLAWAGHHWRPDIGGKQALAKVEDVAQEYLRIVGILRARKEDPKVEDEEKKILDDNISSLLARAKRLRGTTRKEVINYCHSGEASLAISGDELDANPWLLGTSNGVLDLRTLEHRPGRPDDYITRTTAVEWQGLEADAAPFMNFLSDILDENELDVAFMLRFLGMALYAGQREHKFLVLYGEGGRNGKDTLMSILGDVLGGDLCSPVPPEMLMEQPFVRDYSKPSPEIMSLRGKRIIHASETSKRHRFDAETVKRITGGGREKARGLMENNMSQWERTHTLIMLCNDLPAAPPDDEAFWDRLYGIPLVRRFVDDPDSDPGKKEFKKNPDLREQMRSCGPGILAALAKGFLDYLQNGLNPSPNSTSFREKYRKEEDTVARFLDECCTLHEDREAGKTQNSELYDCYYWWFSVNISRKVYLNARGFSAAMKKKGFEVRKISSNHYMGVTIEPGAAAAWAAWKDEKKGRGGKRDE